jgi:hypothetical protein
VGPLLSQVNQALRSDRDDTAHSLTMAMVMSYVSVQAGGGSGARAQVSLRCDPAG